MSLAERILSRLLHHRVITGREMNDPYLSRWYILGTRFDSNGKKLSHSRLPFSLFIHRFHRSDDDGCLHSHPWAWSVALILRGGYSEERRVGDEVIRRLVRPWRLNFIRGTDYHRVDLVGHDAWSLFLAGPKVSTWYFWDRETKRRAEWRSFIAMKRGLEWPTRGWEADSRAASPEVLTRR
jgi:hypothetical protein